MVALEMGGLIFPLATFVMVQVSSEKSIDQAGPICIPCPRGHSTMPPLLVFHVCNQANRGYTGLKAQRCSSKIPAVSGSKTLSGVTMRQSLSFDRACQAVSGID